MYVRKDLKNDMKLTGLELEEEGKLVIVTQILGCQKLECRRSKYYRDYGKTHT